MTRAGDVSIEDVRAVWCVWYALMTEADENGGVLADDSHDLWESTYDEAPEADSMARHLLCGNDNSYSTEDLAAAIDADPWVVGRLRIDCEVAGVPF